MFDFTPLIHPLDKVNIYLASFFLSAVLLVIWSIISYLMLRKDKEEHGIKEGMICASVFMAAFTSLNFSPLGWKIILYSTGVLLASIVLECFVNMVSTFLNLDLILEKITPPGLLTAGFFAIAFYRVANFHLIAEKSINFAVTFWFFSLLFGGMMFTRAWITISTKNPR